MKNILIILFSFLISKSLEFSNLRILDGDSVKENALIIYELRFERNDLVMKASNKTDNLKNETNATLCFRNHDKKRKNIQCRFNNSNSDGYFLIYCNITLAFLLIFLISYQIMNRRIILFLILPYLLELIKYLHHVPLIYLLHQLLNNMLFLEVLLII